MEEFAGKRVVVTAGGAGIGAVLAGRFQRAGAKVAVCDLDRDAVAEADGDILAVQADVRDEGAMKHFFGLVEEGLGGVDILCANAGTGGPAGAIEELSLEDWRNCISANLDGAFLSCRWAAQLMKAQGNGCIILTSSTAGLFGYPKRSPYATAKWGVIGLMKTLATELGPSGIRVNALCPGAVEGPRMDRILAAEARAHGKSENKVRETYVKGVSMRSWVTADEVADAALFLASDAGHKISGLAMPVDGHTETISA